MTAFFDFFVDMWTTLINLLSSVVFEFYGYQVNLMAIIFVVFVIGFVISMFWKGAKT